MQKYLALLRGINVSGHNIIKMNDLRRWMLSEGFNGVETFIQSGNLIFETEGMDAIMVESSIHSLIAKQCGMEVRVKVLSKDVLDQCVEDNPFANMHAIEHLYATFLMNVENGKIEADWINFDFHPDEFFHKSAILYGYYPNGYGKSKFTNNYFEKKLKIDATTRNWKTILKLREMLG